MSAVIAITNIVCIVAMLLVGFSLISDPGCSQLSKVYIIYQATTMLLPNAIQYYVDLNNLTLPWATVLRGLVIMSYFAAVCSVPIGFLVFYSEVFTVLDHCDITRQDWKIKVGAAVQSSFINIMAVISLSHMIEVLRIACCGGIRRTETPKSYNLDELRMFYQTKLRINLRAKIHTSALMRVLGGRSLAGIRVRDSPISREVYIKRLGESRLDLKTGASTERAPLQALSWEKIKEEVSVALKAYFRTVAPLKYTMRSDQTYMRSREFQLLLIEAMGQFWEYKSPDSASQRSECCCMCKGLLPNLCIASCGHKYHLGCLAASIMAPTAVQYCLIQECSDLREEFLWGMCSASV